MCLSLSPIMIFIKILCVLSVEMCLCCANFVLRAQVL
jgi:hypothetical protein